MNIPKLKYSSRSREYNNYKQVIIDVIVYDYLFTGLSHRELDEKYTHMTAAYSRGWQSMGILHYLGLKKEFKGIFKDTNINNAISILENSSDEYRNIVSILKRVLKLGVLSQENGKQYDNIEYTTKKEGKKIEYYSNRYERNPKNRELAIAIHGCKCMTCGFEFENMYGEHGKEYIEVHHNKPLSSLDEEVEISPATDLSVVCANCHRMIHRKHDETLSIDELIRIVETNKK